MEKTDRGGLHLELEDSSITWINALVPPCWIIVNHLVGTNQIAPRWEFVGIKSIHSQRRDKEANKEKESITLSQRHDTTTGRASPTEYHNHQPDYPNQKSKAAPPFAARAPPYSTYPSHCPPVRRKKRSAATMLHQWQEEKKGSGIATSHLDST
jgi:hypothetical protein